MFAKANNLTGRAKMKKIIISLSIIAAVAALAVIGTVAFFSDTETSTGNVLQAGALDLKVDSTCKYNGQPVADCTWPSRDLSTEKFFNFTDVKPGDDGEDTVSLYVDNDAWLRLVITPTLDSDVSCTEPELVAESGCTAQGAGELRPQLLFKVWLDNGVGTGFACDNIQNGAEPTIISEGPINFEEETWNLKDYNGAYLPENTTTCFGIAWQLPSTVGNDAQTDTFVFNASFQVQQVRNNLNPVW